MQPDRSTSIPLLSAVSVVTEHHTATLISKGLLTSTEDNKSGGAPTLVAEQVKPASKNHSGSEGQTLHILLILGEDDNLRCGPTLGLSDSDTRRI